MGLKTYPWFFASRKTILVPLGSATIIFSPVSNNNKNFLQLYATNNVANFFSHILLEYEVYRVSLEFFLGTLFNTVSSAALIFLCG
jgi:hypothetical protein